MIKSHTGVMVPARVGMVVDADDEDFILPERLSIVEVWADAGRLLLSDYHSYSADKCTMIFCPPAVGDEVEHAGHKCIISEIDEQEGDCNLIIPEWNDPDDTLCVFLDEIRHADPNLRPAPDYQKRVSE